jgi:hypothetical protein
MLIDALTKFSALLSQHREAPAKKVTPDTRGASQICQLLHPFRGPPNTQHVSSSNFSDHLQHPHLQALLLRFCSFYSPISAVTTLLDLPPPIFRFPTGLQRVSPPSPKIPSLLGESIPYSLTFYSSYSPISPVTTLLNLPPLFPFLAGRKSFSPPSPTIPSVPGESITYSLTLLFRRQHPVTLTLLNPW